MRNPFKEPAYQNVGILALLSVLQGIQLLIIAAAAASFIPFKKTDFVTKIFPVYLPEVRPEREMLLFRFFVILSIAIMAVWTLRHKKRLDDAGLVKAITGYVLFTGACVFIQVFFAFKLFVWGAPQWAKVMLYVTLIASVFAHIFWPELEKILKSFFNHIVAAKPHKALYLFDGAFMVLLVVLLYPYNLDNVLGRMFVQDQFYHLDSLIMAPGFAHLNGLVLNQDIISEYSVGLPIILSDLLNIFHRFDYAGAVALIIGLSIAYYTGLYFLIVLWLRSRALGIIGVLLAVKLQMFHWGVAPLAWQFPSASALRHLPDIFFFAALWCYLQKKDMRWMIAAVVAAGFSLFWMMDVGVYLLAALCAGVLLINWRLMVVIIPLTLLTALTFLTVAQPQAVWQASFWQHQVEFAALFLQGWGALPMTEGLKDKQFFAFIVGFIIPIVYAGSLLFSAARYWQDKNRTEYLFLVVVSVYGLGLYHYFIHRSGVTSYYAVCIPLILILCFWFSRLLERLPQAGKRIVSVLAAGLMLPILLTSYLFTFYPNMLNIGSIDWSIERAYYQQHFDLAADAGMIRALTKSGERVAIVSSFETKILMQAKRLPFFYYSPLVESSLMDDPKARLTYLHTYDRLTRTLEQIATQKPAFIFIENKMLAQQDQTALTRLLKDIGRHYTLFKTGAYLTAYQRTGS